MADERPVARACGRHPTCDAAVHGGRQRRRTGEDRVFSGQYLFAGGCGFDDVQINTSTACGWRDLGLRRHACGAGSQAGDMDVLYPGQIVERRSNFARVAGKTNGLDLRSGIDGEENANAGVAQ